MSIREERFSKGNPVMIFLRGKSRSCWTSSLRHKSNVKGTTHKTARQIAVGASSTLYSEILRKRSAFAITETELKLIAAPAIIGLRRIPKKGYRAPAAIGTPSAL